MTSTTLPNPHSHLHAFNYHTGRPRFHFDEAADAAAAAAAAAAKPWHDGIDAEMIGHAQNKGWKLDNPKEAFSAAAKVARDLEKHFGAPADRIIRMPAADAKPEDIRAYYERLGAPKEAKEYDFSAVKDETIAEMLRATAYERGLNKDAAAAVAAAFAKAMESKSTSDSTVNQQKLAEEKTKLTENWKDKFDFNHLQAIEGARRLGITPEGVKAMESQIGYAATMEAMRKIGANTREDTFVERGAGGTVGDVTTREGALARKSELMADPAWADRFLKGGQAEAREMTRINTMIDGAA